MRIFKIEDCIELMSGLLKSKDFENFTIAEKDHRILTSIAYSTFKGKALSDRQYEVIKKILLTGYKQDFIEKDVDIESSVNNLRLPLRKIDRSEYIAIENYSDNTDGAGWKYHQNAGKCLVVRFPFNMKYSKLIGEIKKLILFPSEHYKSDNYKHILPFTEKIIYKTVSLFKNLIQNIDSDVLKIYNEIENFNLHKEDYVPGIYNFKIKNITPIIAQPLIDKLGQPNLENLYLYYDKRVQIGLDHVDEAHLHASQSSLSPLSKKIMDRTSSLIQIDQKEHSLINIVDSLIQLHRFPLLVILDDKNPLDQLVNFHNITKNIFSDNEISVLFRKENKKEGAKFNDYVKSQKINNKLDLSTKIVYINNKKIPKDVMKEIWEPECVLSLGSVRHFAKIDNLIHQYDLTIHYDNADAQWNDHVWGIEKI
jgi:hypothetical protein